MSASGRERIVLSVCLLSSALTHLDATMMIVALPSIRTELGATDSQLRLVITGYLTAFALVLLLAGRLGDVVGRRLMYVVGQGLFLIAALTVVIASTASVIVIARIVQGVGAGLLLPQGSALIQTLFTGRDRARAYGLLGVSISAATASGPLVAGAVIAFSDTDSAWRWMYAVTMPLSMLVLAAAIWVLPGQSGGRRWADLDAMGASLAGLGLALVLWPLVSVGQGGPVPWWTAAVGCLALIALAAQQRTRAPGTGIIDHSVLRLPQYRPGVLVTTLFFAGSSAVPAVLALVLQERRGYTALIAGLVTIPWAIANGIAAPVGARLVLHFGRGVVAVGSSVVTVALLGIALALWGEPASMTMLIAFGMVIGGVGAGLTIGPNLSVSLRFVPPARAGGASAMMQTGQRLGAAIGSSVALAILFAAGGRGGGALSMLACGTGVALAAAIATLTRRDNLTM